MTHGDNPDLLCQDCSQPLFRWFLGRIDWKRTLKEMTWKTTTCPSVPSATQSGSSPNANTYCAQRAPHAAKHYHARCATPSRPSTNQTMCSSPTHPCSNNSTPRGQHDRADTIATQVNRNQAKASRRNPTHRHVEERMERCVGYARCNRHAVCLVGSRTLGEYTLTM